MAVSDWSTVAANNNAAPPSGWPEGMTPGNVNDVGRKMMADIRSFYDGANTTNDSAANVGFKGIPQNAQNGNYTLVLGDAGKQIYKASGAGNTITIPANASVAFPEGTAITFINVSGNDVSIAITTDTLVLAGAGTTGTRTLSGTWSVATAIKYNSTSWVISGTGLS